MPTRYQIALYQGPHILHVLGYSARRTQQVLKRYAGDHGPYILSLLSEAEADADYTITRDRITFGSISVGFTGRTERHPD